MLLLVLFFFVFCVFKLEPILLMIIMIMLKGRIPQIVWANAYDSIWGHCSINHEACHIFNVFHGDIVWIIFSVSWWLANFFDWSFVVIFALIYTAGPFALAYIGGAEIISFLFFGPVSIIGTYTYSPLLGI